ncbi:MAG TPA: hypothetical protein VL346_12930 [Acidobacteriaceae bacterium]|nr:hypothetical protein [Acidobacteriaceae bacterium]
MKQGAGWSASIGHPAASGSNREPWLIRLVPEGSGRPSGGEKSSASRGWDLAISPASDQNYPDALLLASPPYGSLNSREIAATYGMRAQDAIAWSPRHFHFFTASETLLRARRLYEALLSPKTPAATRQQASTELLNLSVRADSIAAGRIEILDAHLVAGSADPAPFAAEWAASFDRVPHTLDPVGPDLAGSDPAGEKSSPQGQLHSLRFRITLDLPTSWKAPSGSGTTDAKCAE